MATTEQLPPPPGLPGSGDENQEREFARKLAERYRFAFIDLREQRIDAELFRTIPADLMFRYNFVPLELRNNVLAIAAADPGQVQMSDELPLLLGKKLLIRVATARQISDILKRTEQSQRVLEQATEAFTLQTSKEEEESEETISGDRLTRDSTASPVVRLVETIIFTALERRASDIHIEARDSEVAVKYRIDGVLQHAMQPIAKEWHSTVLSRIKVLSDLDIAERRVPQDGRFRVKYKGRYIDLRVSIMPASHGEDAQIDVAAFVFHTEAAVLRDAALGNVQITQHFDAREHRGMPFLGNGLHSVLQHAVDAVFDGDFRVARFDMNVTGAALERGEYDGFHEAHNRARGAIAGQAVAGNCLFALVFFLGSLKSESFGRLLEHALRLLGALQNVADLAGGSDANQELLAQQEG